MSNFKVNGGHVLVFGDLHFSDVFTGRHKNYLQNCFRVLGDMSNLIDSKNPSAIVLLGDIVGWLETNVRNREVLSMLCRIFRDWSKNGTRPIFAVKGNHDIKGYPEFLFLSELGLLVTSAQCDGYFDYYSGENGKHEARFHIVDYNCESRELQLPEDDNVSNIVLGHNNYTIQGYTNWYQEHNGIELGLLQNYANVDMVISGHIHAPSPEIYYATMPGGKTCGLLYTGCPTRPIKDKPVYESCWVVDIYFSNETGFTEIDTIKMDLQPASELFYDDTEFIEDKADEDIQEELRKEALMDVLGDMLKYRMGHGDPIEQIDKIPNASVEAKAVAKSYLQQALNNSQSA